jgi:hypothetical protein
MSELLASPTFRDRDLEFAAPGGDGLVAADDICRPRGTTSTFVRCV